jgi:hypothetical protein
MILLKHSTVSVLKNGAGLATAVLDHFSCLAPFIAARVR